MSTLSGFGLFLYVGAMQRLSDVVEQAKDLWAVGFGFLLLLAASLAVGVVTVGFPLLIIELALGLSEGWAMNWLLVSSILWGPLLVGKLAIGFRRHLPSLSLRP